MTETRRHALKMLGTIGLTCAFPFAGDELYGQHVHVTLAQTPRAGPYAPAFFTPAEYATLSRLTDVIIPPTDTPGAVGAGVPEYIDRVVSLNAEHQPLVRAGLAWLERRRRHGSRRTSWSLEKPSTSPSCSRSATKSIASSARRSGGGFGRTRSAAVYYVAITDKSSPAPQPRSVPSGRCQRRRSGSPVRLFRLIKNLTADGYYTSRVGLLEELGYTGNTALASFPSCTVREH